MALAIPAFAGTTATVAPAPAPAPAPSLTEWFIGASYGQLNNVDTGLQDVLVVDNNGEIDFDLYSLQFGRNLGCFGGFSTAVYLEVGYGDGDTTLPYSDSMINYDAQLDFEMIPVTINFKLERTLVGGLGIYGTVGAGYAWTKTSVDFEAVYNDADENDGGFYAQATAGLVYNFNETFAVFGGARWSYLDSVNWGNAGSLSDNDALGWEIGARYSF